MLVLNTSLSCCEICSSVRMRRMLHFKVEPYHRVQSAAVHSRIPNWACHPAQKKPFLENNYMDQTCRHKAKILTEVGFLQRDGFI